MTNTKISLKEAYDNRDVIAQIVDLRTEAGEATDASANAVATSNHAATLAGNAVDTANAASAVANGIDAKATQALEKSAEAVTASHKAEGTADAASAVADAAAATANGIDGKAQQALDTAGDAMLEASDASAKAIAVDKKIDASNVRIGALEQTEGQHEAKISTLQRDLNNVKAEYLDKFDLNEVQLIRSKTDFETEPLIRTVASGDVDKDNGRHAVNYATMKRDAVMKKGPQSIDGPIEFLTVPKVTRDFFKVVDMNRQLMTANLAIRVIAGVVPAFSFIDKTDVLIDKKTTVIGTSAYARVTLATKDVEIVGYYLSNRAFYQSDMTTIKFTGIDTYLDSGAMTGIAELTKCDINSLFQLNYECFANDTALNTLIIRSPVPATMRDTNCFENTGITNGTGYIYVPDEAVETYRTTTNWTLYADRIKGISELPAEASS